MPTATPSRAPTAAAPAAAPTLSTGQKFLAAAKKAWDAKNLKEAAVQGDLAADVLASEKAPVPQQIEAHKIAGQAYYKRQQNDKALKHYQALQKLDPKNAEYRKTVAALATRMPSKQGPLVISEEHRRRREEARLNRKIKVRIMPYGYITTMTVREYERRERGESTSSRRPLNY